MSRGRLPTNERGRGVAGVHCIYSRGTTTPEGKSKGLEPQFAGVSSVSKLRQPSLKAATSLEPETKDLSPTRLEKTNEEVDAGDVIRIDTNLVTVPVSVLDR